MLLLAPGGRIRFPTKNEDLFLFEEDAFLVILYYYTGCFTDSGFFEMLITPSILELSL